MYNVAKIEQEMRRRAWTMTELARRSGVAVSTVQRTFKVGSAHPANIEKIARAAGLSMDAVLAQSETPKSSGKKKAKRRRAA